MTLSKIIKKATTAVLTLLCISNSPSIADNTLRIHYSKQDKQYDQIAIWFWGNVKNQSAGWPTGATKVCGKDDYGVYFDVELDSNPSQVSFLVLNIAKGERIEENRTVYLTDNRDVFVRAGDPNVYESKDFKINTTILQAVITDENEMKLSFNQMEDADAQGLAQNIKINNNENETIKLASVTVENKNQAILKTNTKLENKFPISVTYGSRKVDAIIDWHYIDKNFAYDGDDLGCQMEKGEATLKLWAPIAESVKVRIYSKNDQNLLIGTKISEKDGAGVWKTQISLSDLEEGIDCLEGCYYQYEVKNPGQETALVLDPYAKSMATVCVSGDATEAEGTKDFVGKAAFVDFGKVKTPVTKANIKDYNRREDAIIYEVHVRDFTSDPNIANERTGKFGSFKAFIGRLPYLKSLGVTHVQLLPLMAWYYGNEHKMGEPEYEYKSRGCNYNWGYDPHQYFSLDGAYSENPDDAMLRIEEFRELVNEIHKAGMGVIMDCVYTHMATSKFLDSVLPNYYFFRDDNGNLIGMFGNNLATTRKMVAKLMVDSVKHWFKEYGIDGLRWDMMGDATYPVVQACCDAAKEINPKAIFIGEGWRTFSGYKEDSKLVGMGADQDWMAKTMDMGSFSDEMRNEMKSGFDGEGQPRFLSGKAADIRLIFDNIKGQPRNFKTSSPGSVVQYVEAHDNLTLFDCLAMATGLDPETEEGYAELHKRARLGLTFVLTAQGTAFIHSGQEYGRTKQWLADGVPEQKYYKLVDKNGNLFKHPYFIHDSYDSSDAINKFEWEKATNAEKSPISVASVDYAKGLIALRKSTDAFRLGTIEAVNENVRLLEIPEIKNEDLAIAYACKSAEKNEVYYVFVNCDSVKRDFSLTEDLTKSEVLVDGEVAGIVPIESPKGFTLTPTSISIEPLTSVIFKQMGD